MHQLFCERFLLGVFPAEVPERREENKSETLKIPISIHQRSQQMFIDPAVKVKMLIVFQSYSALSSISFSFFKALID